MTAEEAVLQAIEQQYQFHKPANRLTVLARATMLLAAASGGQRTYDSAWKEVEAAVQSLTTKNKIEASLSDSSKDWTIK